MCGVVGTLKMWCGWNLTEMCSVAGTLKMWCDWDLTEVCGVAGTLQKCVVWLGPYRSVSSGHFSH